LFGGGTHCIPSLLFADGASSTTSGRRQGPLSQSSILAPRRKPALQPNIHVPSQLFHGNIFAALSAHHSGTAGATLHSTTSASRSPVGRIKCSAIRRPATRQSSAEKQIPAPSTHHPSLIKSSAGRAVTVDDFRRAAERKTAGNSYGYWRFWPFALRKPGLSPAISLLQADTTMRNPLSTACGAPPPCGQWPRHPEEHRGQAWLIAKSVTRGHNSILQLASLPGFLKT